MELKTILGKLRKFNKYEMNYLINNIDKDKKDVITKSIIQRLNYKQNNYDNITLNNTINKIEEEIQERYSKLYFYTYYNGTSLNPFTEIRLKSFFDIKLKINLSFIFFVQFFLFVMKRRKMKEIHMKTLNNDKKRRNNYSR